MLIRTKVVPATHALPAFPFRWDAETEILSGRRDVAEASESGFTGSWELESPSGAVVVLETSGGGLCGIEVVVWPDVERAPDLVLPHKPEVAVVHLLAPADETVGLLEIEMPIAAAATSDETLIHLRLGQAAKTVRLAENVLVDLDAAGQLAGLWLVNVPPFTQGG